MPPPSVMITRNISGHLLMGQNPGLYGVQFPQTEMCGLGRARDVCEVVHIEFIQSHNHPIAQLTHLEVEAQSPCQEAVGG